MELIPVNLSDLKRVEPLMIKYYGFNRSMLYDEVEALFHTYNHNLDEFIGDRDLSQYQDETTFMYEVQDYNPFNPKRYTNQSKDKYIDHQAVIFDSDKTLYINVTNDKLFNELDELTNEFELVHENDVDVVSVLLYMAAIYDKYISGGFDNEDIVSNISDSLIYTKFVRPEMLQLYEFLQTSKLANLQIKSPNGSVSISNTALWFTDLLKNYLHIYLGVENLEEAQSELKFTYGKKAGRKFDEPAFNIMAMGTFNILQHSTIASTKAGAITNQQCDFILRYLEVIGCFKNDDRKNDMNYIRSAISIMKKQNFIPKWDYLLNSTFQKSPNNPTETCYW